MISEETNKRLWKEAQDKFQSRITDAIKNAEAAAIDSSNVRHATLLEVATIIETELEHTRRTPDSEHTAETLEMLLEQVVGLLTTAADQK